MKRPTFFISSTIYDFRDLRSALKFYLEQQGCKVLASEFNDFSKPLDMHSYEACLSSIHSADYFILLIGDRVGGWYDETNRVSITQKEYREAYQLQKSGKLKLINFVRTELWQFRESRYELVKFLESTALDHSMRNAISNYPNKFATDAEFLSSFISEVARNKETKLAIQGKGAVPTNNWVHVFSNFRDIIDVLHGQIFTSTPVEDMAAQRLLRRELRDIAGQCLVKYDNKVFSPRYTIEKFHATNPITLKEKGRKFTAVSTKLWDVISSLSIHLLGLKFHIVVIPQILSQSTFLEFDLASNSYKETSVYEALLRIQDEIRRFMFSNTTENMSVVFKYSQKNRSHSSNQIEIETIELAGILHLLDRWSNILDLSTSILQFLDGAAFKMPELRPDTPIQGMQSQLENERANDQDIESYVANWKTN